MRVRGISLQRIAAPLLLAVFGLASGGVASICRASLPYAPATGLGHYWALNESAGTAAVDSVGGVTGTLAAGPVWQPDGGRFGGAVEFDGVDDRIDLGTMDLPSTAAMSITLWFRADDFGIPDARFISKATGSQTADHYFMVSTINSTALRFRLKAGGTTSTLATATGVVSAGEWYHVAVTYDGDFMRIYCDGQLITEMPKSGTIDTNPAVAASIGNQPPGAGGQAFDGLIDDVRVYARALTAEEIAAMVPPKPPFVFTLWTGEVLEVGQRGTPQQWVNITGTVSNPANLDSLYYRLRGGPPSLLTAGPDGFRLVSDGDFNVELDTEDLIPGDNDVELSGVHFNGKRADTTVTVVYTPGVSAPLPDTLAFSAASQVSDVASVVDGCWELTPEGARTCPGSMGYDRLLAAGQRHWGSDVEVLVPITIHDYETVFPDNGPAIGVGFGWQGHTGTGQPRLGHPYQSIGFIRGLASSPYLELMRNGDVGVAVVPAAIAIGTRYLLRIQSQATTATTSRVRMKVWVDGSPEPGAWQIQNDFTTRTGSILLIAHRADVTFGDAIIAPLSSPIVAVGDRPPHAVLSVLPNVPNPFGDGTTIRVALSAPAEIDMEVYDVRGRLVTRRVVPRAAAGLREFRFDAVDSRGQALPSGVYFYRVRALGEVVTRRLVVSR